MSGADSGAVTAFDPPVATLAARRPFIHFPDYTAEQRQQIAAEAQLLFHEAYVHRLHKIEYYGAWIDPLPKIDWLAANAGNLSNDAFQLAMQALFDSVRDLHQNYYFPTPFSCYASQLPLTFATVADPAPGALLPLVAVEQLSTAPELVALEPQLGRIALGDVLIAYDGLPTALAVAALVPSGAGANFSGATERAVQELSYRSHRRQPLPLHDSVRMTLERADQSRYDVELPWLSIAGQAAGCSDAAASAPPIAAGKGSGAGQTPKDDALLGTDEFQLEYAQRFHLAQLRSAPLTAVSGPEPEPIISYGKLAVSGHTFGYLHLASFTPEVLYVSQTIDEIARILRDELPDTEGLILDVRDNGGGYITMADQLPQLFSAQPVVVNGFRLLNSPLNVELANTHEFANTDWQTLMNEVGGTSARFTRTAQITTTAVANSRTQVYFKPVALLTNATCFSSCDMFSAMMQDNGLATIWGEQERTGAGGANVVTDAYLRQISGDPRFPTLPNHQVMRAAWRQTVRAGKSAGRLLEDYGVRRDADATRTLADLRDGGLEQLARVGADLAARSPAARGSVYLAHPDGFEMQVGQPIVIDATIADTDAVEIVSDGQVVGQVAIGVGAAQLVHIATGVRADLPRYYRFELRGLRAGVRVWRAFTIAKALPPYTPLPAGGLDIDFASGDIGPLGIYTTGVPDADGWQVRNHRLTTTQGAHYADGTLSDAMLLLDLRGQASATLTVQASIDTEPDYDYFSIYVFANGTWTALANLTGNLGAQTLQYDLTPFAGQKMLIDLEFSSDEATEASGVFVDHVAVR